MFGVGARNGDDAVFDAFDTFEPQHLPEEGPFLDGCDVLEGADHAAFHRLTRWIFEDRGVYDVTFGYNLARLNLDRRHDTAGFRYAVDPEDKREEAREDEREDDDLTLEADAAPDSAPTDGADDPQTRRTLRAEFTPTTEFCPQSEQLTKGAFRAWNGLSERHEYDLVRVRVHPMHQRSVEINAALEALEIGYLTDGSLTLPAEDDSGAESAVDELAEEVPEIGSSTDDVPF